MRFADRRPIYRRRGPRHKGWHSLEEWIERAREIDRRNAHAAVRFARRHNRAA